MYSSMFFTFISIVYYLFYRRRIDFFTIAFCSSFLYFIPIFSGYVNWTGLPIKKVSLEVYYTYCNICMFLMIATYYFDKKYKVNLYLNLENLKKYLEQEKFMLILFFIIMLLCFDYSYIEHGLSHQDKSKGMKSMIFISSLFYVILFLYFKEQWFFKFLVVLLLLFYTLMGNRSIVALFLCVIFFISLYKPTKIPLNRIFLFGILGVVFIILIALSKRIYSLYLSGVPIIEILTDFDELKNNVMQGNGMEFFSTQYIFQTIVDNKYFLEIKYFFYSFLSLLPIPLSMVGYSSSKYNEFYQGDLFPNVTYGMAYNPWAEGFSYFGYYGLVVMPILYVCMIYFGQIMFCRVRILSIKLFMLIFLALTAFYFHRNSLGVHFAFIRNYFYPLFFILIIKSLFNFVYKNNCEIKRV